MKKMSLFILYVALALLLAGIGVFALVLPRSSQAEANSIASPEGTIQAFYQWYLGYHQMGSDVFRSPLSDQAYHDSQYLSEDFVQRVDTLLQEFAQAGPGYDPFLCAQDVPQYINSEGVLIDDNSASVVVSTNFINHAFIVDLVQQGNGWYINDVTCIWSPEGTTKAFYTWYLANAYDRNTGEPLRPLVANSFGERFLTPEFFTSTQNAAGFDPVLLAQDFPQRFSVSPGIIEGTVIVHQVFGSTSELDLQISLVQEGAFWLISEVSFLPETIESE